EGRTADVSSPFGPLRPHARAGDALPEGRPGVGRAHRRCPPPAYWRLIAFGNLCLATGLAGGLIWVCSRGTVTPWVVEVDRLGQAQAVSPAIADYRPTLHRPPELALGLRLHHRQGRRRAQRLCPRQRSVRQGRENPIVLAAEDAVEG